MAIVAYYRVSTSGQSTDSQRLDIETKYKVSRTFEDVCSGTVKAEDREGFTACLEYIREGDQLVVWDLDRLGRDSIDVQITIQKVKEKGASIFIESMGVDLNSDAGELLIVIMSKVAEMERKKILARTEAGRKAARDEGRHMGRPVKINIDDVMQLRNEGVSISETAKRLNCSLATVKNLTAKGRALAANKVIESGDYVSIIRSAREAGETFISIAEKLSNAGVKSASGKSWTKDMVKSAYNRLIK